MNLDTLLTATSCDSFELWMWWSINLCLNACPAGRIGIRYSLSPFLPPQMAAQARK